MGSYSHVLVGGVAGLLCLPGELPQWHGAGQEPAALLVRDHHHRETIAALGAYGWRMATAIGLPSLRPSATI